MIASTRLKAKRPIKISAIEIVPMNSVAWRARESWHDAREVESSPVQGSGPGGHSADHRKQEQGQAERGGGNHRNQAARIVDLPGGSAAPV